MLKKIRKNRTHKYRGEISGRNEGWMKYMMRGGGCQEVQNSSYQINQSWGGNVWHGDHS